MPTSLRLQSYVFGIILLTLPYIACAQTSAAPGDAQRTATRRAAELVSHMTLEEKVSQMQNTSAGIPRLGIPAYDWWSEALHGVARSGYRE